MQQSATVLLPPSKRKRFNHKSFEGRIFFSFNKICAFTQVCFPIPLSTEEACECVPICLLPYGKEHISSEGILRNVSKS
jgi:hypothetical protein